ncbi:MAG: site-specific integrase [Candidatus Thiodiazotropha endolucinida]
MAEKLNFTKKALESLPIPEQGRSYYLDTKIPRLGLTITPKGTKSFHVRTTVNGMTKRIALKNGTFPEMTVEKARKKAQKILSEVADSIDPVQKRRVKKSLSVTLREVFESYLADRDLKPGTVKDYRRAFKETFDEWMEKPLSSITDRMVQTRYQERGKISKARTDNAARVLAAVFRYAQAKYRDSEGATLFPRNPVDIIKETKTRYKIPRKKRILARDALPAWFEAVKGLNNEVSRDYFLFLLFTGARREEAAKLQWQDVNFTAKTFCLTDTKNREVVDLPLPEYVANRLLARKGRKRVGWVFPAKVGKTGYLTDPRKSIAIVRKASKANFSPHDLRRTFISIAESLDLSVYTIKALVNHKVTTDVTAGYVVQTPERLAKASRRIESEILRLTGENAGKVVQIKSTG